MAGSECSDAIEVRIYVNSFLSEPIVHHATNGTLFLSEDDPEIGKDICVMAINNRAHTTPMKTINAHGSSKVYVLKMEVCKDYMLEREKLKGSRYAPTIIWHAVQEISVTQ